MFQRGCVGQRFQYFRYQITSPISRYILQKVINSCPPLPPTLSPRYTLMIAAWCRISKQHRIYQPRNQKSFEYPNVSDCSRNIRSRILVNSSSLTSRFSSYPLPFSLCLSSYFLHLRPSPTFPTSPLVTPVLFLCNIPVGKFFWYKLQPNQVLLKSCNVERSR